MAAPVTKNRPTQPAESKGAKKKKGGKAERSDSPAPASTPSTDKPVSVAGNDTSPDDENQYIRDLTKALRNVNKKLTNCEKNEALVAEHKDKSLDELVEKKTINPDQKASVENKPRLLAQKAQLEEQLAQYKKVDQEYREKLSSLKADLEQTLTSKYEAEVAKAAANAKEAAEAAGHKKLDDSLLALSQFLCLAAARRSAEFDQGSVENLAIEGVLLNVYTGDSDGVATMKKLAEGSSERTKTTTGAELDITFATVKELAIKHTAFLDTTSEEVPAAAGDEAPVEPATDPTVAHASLTEIEAGEDVALTNGHAAEEPVTAPPPNGDIADSAANAAAEAQWDAANASMSVSQEWVEVPSNPAETDSGSNAGVAAAPVTQSWADDAAENAADLQPQADPNDGFQSVQRNRGRGDRDGNGRGRGNNYRGRGGGFRGDGRGRGRGGRGGNGGFRRGGPRNEES